jgi:hypothetical protein
LISSKSPRANAQIGFGVLGASEWVMNRGSVFDRVDGRSYGTIGMLINVQSGILRSQKRAEHKDCGEQSVTKRL